MLDSIRLMNYRGSHKSKAVQQLSMELRFSPRIGTAVYDLPLCGYAFRSACFR
jgi:hypothetical protein